MGLLTEKEHIVLDALVEVWNEFIELPIEHPDDQKEFRLGILQLEQMIMSRPTRRELNK